MFQSCIYHMTGGFGLLCNFPARGRDSTSVTRQKKYNSKFTWSFSCVGALGPFSSVLVLGSVNIKHNLVSAVPVCAWNIYRQNRKSFCRKCCPDPVGPLALLFQIKIRRKKWNKFPADIFQWKAKSLKNKDDKFFPNQIWKLLSEEPDLPTVYPHQHGTDSSQHELQVSQHNYLIFPNLGRRQYCWTWMHCSPSAVSALGPRGL